MEGDSNENRREVLQLHIGSAGIETGRRCWQLYCLEHGLNADGQMLNETQQIVPPTSFFKENNDNNHKFYQPHALFADCYSSTLDTVRSSQHKNLFMQDQFHLFSNSCESFLDTIHKKTEEFDNFQGFILSHPTYGRCSHFVSSLIEHLASNYSTKTITTNSIFGSSVDIANMYKILNHAHVVLPMENKAIFDLCKHRLEIDSPTYTHINRLIGMCWSHITCSMRFDGCLLTDLNEFRRELVPFPNLKIISSFLSPLIPFVRSTNADFQSPSVYDMSVPLFAQARTCFVQQRTPYKLVISSVLLFRGENIIPKEIGQKLICDMKQWWRFWDQTPSGFKCGINYYRPYIFKNDSDVALTDKQVCALMNEVVTSKYLCETSVKQFDRSVEKQSESTDSNEVMEFFQELIKQYEEIETEVVQTNELNLNSSFP